MAHMALMARATRSLTRSPCIFSEAPENGRVSGQGIGFSIPPNLLFHAYGIKSATRTCRLIYVAAPCAGHGRHQCCISKNRGDMLCRASLLRGKPWNQDGGHRAQGGPVPWAEDEPNETGVVTLNINIKLREENEHELG